MNFREKSAWLNVLAMLAAYSLYFGLIIAGHPAGREVFPMLWLFGSIALAHAAIVIVGTIILSAQAPKALRLFNAVRRGRAGARGGGPCSPEQGYIEKRRADVMGALCRPVGRAKISTARATVEVIARCIR